MTRKDVVYTILGGFFITNAVLAELIGGKIIRIGPENWQVPLGPLGTLGPFYTSVGVFPWPVVFLTTDLINEYFGRRGVRRLSIFTAGLIVYVFVVLWVTRMPEAVLLGTDGVTGASYNNVFGTSQYIIVGSVAAFLVAQLVDVSVFHLFRRRTGPARLWLRATGSTVVSQLIDSLIVLYIGLAWPLKWGLGQYLSTALTSYTLKLSVAVAMTPLIYLGHWAVESYLGKPEADALAEAAARDAVVEPVASAS